ncbi:hypothetical protein [Asticcacaulis endophyticus]|uniref:Uncharacterized protein n=1 Tax=Asticcacaulis endophyticus TaxID=1395890 RepID=A0A918Q5Q8_9CAUL|nr:hypothetical protein [Asticcacaulis endophyticus]GGZ32926.1 hypothetical protein GCM10011273_19010 [Asticcacaulis endophyticus]
MNLLRRNHNGNIAGYRAELIKLDREREQIVKAVLDGIPGASLKDRAIRIETRREEVERFLVDMKEEPIAFHPSMANQYHKEIKNLLASLNSEDRRNEAAAILRSLIDRVVITPTKEGDRLTVDLIGDLGGILSMATKRDRNAVLSDLSKLQPVQQADDDFLDGDVDLADFHQSKALVAGTRYQRDFDSNHQGKNGKVEDDGHTLNLGADFASSISSHPLCKEAVVAGARTHLECPMPSTAYAIAQHLATSTHSALFRVLA